MKMPVRWMMPELRLALLVMISGGLLAACATKREPVKKAATSPVAPKVEAPKVEAPKVEAHKVEAHKVEAHKVEAHKVEAHKVEAHKVEAHKVEAHKVEAHKVEANKSVARLEEASGDASDAPRWVVPGPDGKARVLVTRAGISLQRQPGGPLEPLDESMGEDDARWAEQMKELAQGVQWSPRGTRVCILRLYKRGSGVTVFTLAEQPAAEVEVTVWREALIKRYGPGWRHGRFYYDALSRWIDEDHLELDISGNLVPKEDDDGTNWKSYHGTARIELGPKSGTVQGPVKMGPLTD